ncbi:hypothetical protein FRB94_002380 [Tulasnella sp. JGI-2019a]|nr:hypothetical protein FRB93_004403 [Tulasnella sp. JGI-2019a]KAG9004435.1 hypothetical protein FRB94_002380 [Tulasnella sp. JGI-2019a]
MLGWTPPTHISHFPSFPPTDLLLQKFDQVTSSSTPPLNSTVFPPCIIMRISSIVTLALVATALASPVLHLQKSASTL